MTENINDLNSGNSLPKKPIRDEATKNKIDKHLSDIDDTISEDDIKNINTSLTAKDISVAEKDADEVSAEPKSETEDKESKKEMPNTWDMVDE